MNSKLRLLHHPASQPCRSARQFLIENNISFEDEVIDLTTNINERQEFRDEYNPTGQVPILVDGDVVVYDSTLIFEYLEDAYPEPSLFPLDAVERARCRRFEAAADEILFPHVWALIDEIFYPTAEHYMMAEKARCFGDDESLAKIMATKDPSEAKRIGRKVRGFDDVEWDVVKYGTVLSANLAKFGDDPKLLDFLLTF